MHVFLQVPADIGFSMRIRGKAAAEKIMDQVSYKDWFASLSHMSRCLAVKSGTVWMPAGFIT